MTVKQLIAELQKCKPNAQVIIDKGGGEGSPLADVDPNGIYRAESTWAGELKHPDDKQPGDKLVVALSVTN